MLQPLAVLVPQHSWTGVALKFHGEQGSVAGIVLHIGERVNEFGGSTFSLEIYNGNIYYNIHFLKYSNHIGIYMKILIYT